MMTDIEIAQSTQVKPILEIAQAAGIDEKYIEMYGRYKAKVDFNLLSDKNRKTGKLILVTAMPCAMNVSAYAEQCKNDTLFASQLVFLSTLLSAITIPFFVVLVEYI